MNYYEEPYYEEPYYESIPEYLKTVNNIVESEISRRNVDILEENVFNKEKIKKQYEEIRNLKSDIDILKHNIKVDENKNVIMDKVLTVLNLENLRKMISLLGFNKTLDIGYSQIPEWMSLVLEYYNDKDFIFTLLRNK